MKVLVLGSGQLARMMYLAATPLGIHIDAVNVADNSVVNPVSKEKQSISLNEAIQEAGAITVEFEHIPLDLLERCHASGKLMPGIHAILAGADRVREKALLDKLAIANCPYQIITAESQLDAAMQALGERLILKASRDGYDGYGQWRIQSQQDIPQVQSALKSLDLTQVPLVVEKMLDFERELSLVGSRDKQGNMAFYPLAQNAHHKGQLHVSIAPAPNVSHALQAQAEEAFTKLANELEYVGTLAIEFFQMQDQLLVNEIAPRVHNSGHWSMQGADTCQFENHLRAVAGLPLGDSAANFPTAMINIIGVSNFSRDLLSIQGSHLHWYAKQVREKRKMGHINVTAPDYVQLADRLSQLASYLPEEHFPILAAETAQLAKA